MFALVGVVGATPVCDLEQGVDGAYLIASEAALVHLRDAYSSCYSATDARFRQTADIDLVGPAWTLGIGDYSTPFAGSYDGAGHTIANFVLNGADDIGLFGNIQGATLRNLTLSNPEVTGRGWVGIQTGGDYGEGGTSLIEGITIEGGVLTASGFYVGSVVGYGVGVTVRDILVVGTNVQADELVGGIAGGLYGQSSIERVTVQAVQVTISAKVGYGGGLVGALNGSSLSDAAITATVRGMEDVGGAVGSTYRSSLRGVRVTGSRVEGSAYVGGLVGSMNEAALHDSTVSETFIAGTGNSVAGIAGYLQGGTISDTAFRGYVIAPTARYVGGMVGRIAIDPDAAAIHRSLAEGTVTGGENVGGLVGWQEYGSVVDSYSNVSVTGLNWVGGAVGWAGFSDDAGVRRAEITRVYAIGSAKADDATPFVAGLVGYLNAGSVSDSVWNPTRSGQSVGIDSVAATHTSVSGMVSLSDLEMADLASYPTWAMVAGWATSGPPDAVWGIHPSRNQGFPYLLWEYGPLPVEPAPAPPPPPPVVPSSDASLTTLTADGAVLTPAFTPDVTFYSASLAHETAAITVTATSANHASITINGAGGGVGRATLSVAVPSDAPVVVAVQVVSEDASATRTYTLTLTRQAAPDAAAPSALRAIPGVGGVWLDFTPPAGEVRNYQVSHDGGAWTAFYPAQVSGPLWIGGLTPGASVGLRLRALFDAGWGPASNEVGVVLPEATLPQVAINVPPLTNDPGEWVRDGERLLAGVVMTLENRGSDILRGLWWTLNVPGATVVALEPVEVGRGEVLALNGGWYWWGLALEAGESTAVRVTLAVEVE